MHSPLQNTEHITIYLRDTPLGWESCDHTGPVQEGDTLYSELHVEAAHEAPGRGGTLDLRSVVFAVDADGPDRQVLDWRFSVLQF